MPVGLWYIDIPWCMLGWGELTQSDMLLGNTPAVMPEETTALPNMSRLISCSICNRAGSVRSSGGGGRSGTIYKLRLVMLLWPNYTTQDRRVSRDCD